MRLQSPLDTIANIMDHLHDQNGEAGVIRERRILRLMPQSLLVLITEIRPSGGSPVAVEMRIKQIERIE
jgi:hypothetical protein